MECPNLYKVGDFLLSQAIYADGRITKTSLAETFDLRYPSVWRYDKVAFYTIYDYREDYPELPKDQWLIRKSKRDRTVPLTPYQVWVLSLVRAAFTHFRRESLVKEYITQNSYVFSKSRYIAQLNKLAKAGVA